MQIQNILAVIIFILYILEESFIRFGKDAKSLDKTKFDRGSTGFMRIAWVIAILGLLVSPVLNYFNILKINLKFIGWIGIILMYIGVTIRTIEAITLGRYYTRILRIIDDHKIISSGVYRIIRHPGYLGVLLLFNGSAIALLNLITIVVVFALSISALIYRINIEESMLIQNFGEKYNDYIKKTWRLIPFIY